MSVAWLTSRYRRRGLRGSSAPAWTSRHVICWISSVLPVSFRYFAGIGRVDSDKQLTRDVVGGVEDGARRLGESRQSAKRKKDRSRYNRKATHLGSLLTHFFGAA